MEFRHYREFSPELKRDWNALLDESVSNVPFLLFEYLETWWENRGGGEWPQDSELAILAGYENDHLVGIAPCFIAEHEGLRSLMFLGSIEISDYLDLIVRPEDEERFIAGMTKFIADEFANSQHLEALDLYNFLDQSPTLPLVQKAAAALGWDWQQETLQHSPFIQLPGDWETYLASIDKKQRHEIRRKMRRAEESEFPVTWYVTTDQSTLDEDAGEFLRLMAHDDEKKQFLTDQMRLQMKAAMKSAFDAGILQLAFLTVNGAKAAAYWNFDYKGRIWVYNSGLDRNYTEYSPGWVLLGHLLRWANENGRTEFDFMRGDEDYKYRFGAVDRFVIRARMILPK